MLISEPTEWQKILDSIFNNKIVESHTGKAFIINIIAELAAMGYTKNFWYPLTFVYHCIFLVTLCAFLEKAGLV